MNKAPLLLGQLLSRKAALRTEDFKYSFSSSGKMEGSSSVRRPHKHGLSVIKVRTQHLSSCHIHI